MAIIDNKSQTMHEALINALDSVERVDIEVAFFYFSGWKLLVQHLKNKRVRILVGKYIDPDAIPKLLSFIKQEGEDVDLERFQPQYPISSRTVKKQMYMKGFTRLANESALFDDSEVQDAYKILESKVADGTLEIKLTNRQEHGKMYILHNKPAFSQGGDLPGTVFMGSSNLTFQGLLNQGELNERYNDKDRYQQYVNKFESLWKDSDNIAIATKDNKEEILETFKKELWIHSVPLPYAVYIRILHELFGKEIEQDIKTPKQITHDKYMDLEYQLDAIKMALDKLKKYDGAIVADVVGLGKSIIASAVAHNLGLRTVIIAPPHLKGQWEDYQEQFMLPGARVFSSGKIDEVYEHYQNHTEPILIIVDEAHRYRNEDTNDYQMLHHICHGNPANKVLLLTATPFNNTPKDIYALIKLFQIPGQSTIRSVDNLSLRFRELIERYRKLNKYRQKSDADKTHIDSEADGISLELRRLIENVVIRRSRIDLKLISRYREDLTRQNINFAEIEGPNLMEYKLGSLENLYLETIEAITGDEEGDGFVGARYKPVTYIPDNKRQEFLKVYGEDFNEIDITSGQTNLAKFMRRLLVMRFESSREAFKITLKNIIDSNKLIEKWWHELGKVPISKKGQIPDPENIIETSDDQLDDDLKKELYEDELAKLKQAKGLLSINKSFIDTEFIKQVEKDRLILEKIYDRWFGEKSVVAKDIDPKLDEVKKRIDELLVERPGRKIIIFSGYADTVTYVYEQLKRRGLERIMRYTSKDSSASMREQVRSNFDAGYQQSKQKDEFDVLIATDALSEGYNLHRAGVIINYDIPYNPTRVIQRIGRINRINKKVFDKLFIYNFFPTMIGEAETKIKQISTLKMRFINAVVGSDTKTLTKEEELRSFLKDEYKKAESEIETISWDAPHREAYDKALKEGSYIQEAMSIKPRSRLVRTDVGTKATVAFGKKGDHAVFALKEKEEANIVSTETALNFFKADKNEEGKEADKHYDEVFKLVRDTLFAKHPLPSIKGRRADALHKLKKLEEDLPKATDYCRDLGQIIREYDGINEGDLKKIARLNLNNLEDSFIDLKNIVPEQQITSINNRVEQLEREYETIVLSEDLRP